MPDVEEVEREFRRYFMTGPVLEDWATWANLFTDDATYLDHFYGTFTGPEEITRFLEGTMGAAAQVYSPLVDFPSYQFIEYAGDGKWRSEEDVWVFAEMKQFAKRYTKAADEHPQTLQQQLRRENWGSWVDWARPEPGHQASPSWLGKDGFTPFSSIQDIDFGVRSH